VLLGALKAYNDRQSGALPSLYANTPVRYVIELDAAGRSTTGGLIDTADPNEPTAKRGQRMPAPQVVRASGVKPLLLADKADYVLGFVSDTSKPDRVEACHRAFLKLLDECAEATGSADARAVAAFLRDDPLGQLRMPDGFDPGATITLTVEGRFPIADPSVQEFWASTHDPVSRGGPLMQCVVCGRERPVVSRLPGKIKGIPGGQTAGTALISANSPAFESYGLEASLVAPTCSPCAEGFTRGLNHLLADRASRLILGGSAFVFWTVEPTTFSFRASVIEGDPESVGALLSSIIVGRPAPIEDPVPFYGLMLSASGGRAVVRDWIDTTVHRVASNAQAWFERQTIADSWSQEFRPLGLYALAMTTVREAKELPPSLLPTLLRSALTGSPLPMSLLARVLVRCRAEQGVSRPQASMIKLVLSTNPETRGEDMVGLREDDSNVAYQCGRLLAVLESAQRTALGDVGAGIVDRFYGSASSAPLTVFPRLLRGVQPHLGKLERDRPAAGRAINDRLTDVMSRIEAFPATLTMVDQGMFALGFYHQHAADRERMRVATERKRNAAGEAETAATA